MTDPIVVTLRERRHDLGLSLEAVARLMGGRSRQALSMYETGRRRPSLETVHAWAGALGLVVAATDGVGAVERKPCGTEAAYRRHLARGEEPCEPCAVAARWEWRRKKAASRSGVSLTPIVHDQPDIAPPSPLDPSSECPHDHSQTSFHGHPRSGMVAA